MGKLKIWKNIITYSQQQVDFHFSHGQVKFRITHPDGQVGINSLSYSLWQRVECTVIVTTFSQHIIDIIDDKLNYVAYKLRRKD